MPRLYPHKVHGWQLVYRIWFPDGRSTDKHRFSKKKALAQLMFKEASDLENLSRLGSLKREDVVSYLNLKYISRAEAEALSRGPVAVTWDELRRQYEETSRKSCAPYTHACNMVKVGKLDEHFKGTPPEAITPESVEAYIEKRLKDRVEKGKPDEDGKRRTEPIKSATIEKELNILRILLDPLGGERRRRRDGIWPDNPARQVKAPRKADERLPRPLWRADIIAFYAALRGRRALLGGYMAPLVMTYLYAGLRPSELINLTRQDVNLSIGVIHVVGKDAAAGREAVRTKTGTARTVEIHPKLRVYIESAMRKGKGGRYVFGGDRRQDGDYVSKAVRQTIEAAGIEGVTPYSLRHTFITGLLRSGADIREVQTRAGHKRLATTMRYLHVAPTKNPVKRIKFKD
ncbi:tyrosine-type recombinase/integrase [bacterium]|nr:tyrosine-type recombinase/integrase [bacterium]